GLSLKPGANQDAIETLGTLVDHSLVQVFTQSSGENRFLMLETLREYGLEQLVLLGEEPDARLAHANWFLQLATAAEPHLVESDQEAWLNRLNPEWDNVRAAANWFLSNGGQDMALRLLGAIWRFCSIRGHATETRVLLDRALAFSTGEKTVWRTRALIAAGNLALGQRDLDMAQSVFEQARVLAIELDQVTDEVQALSGLAKVAVNHSDYTTAIDFHQRAASLARETGDQRAVGSSLGGLAYVAYFQGRLDDAVSYWEEARQVVKALGDNLLESVAVSNLGAAAMVQGEFERAQDLLNRALELQRRMQALDSLPYTLTNLAETWRQLGDYALAEDLLAEAVSRFRELGYKGSEGTCLTSYAQLALDQRDHERAAMLLLESTRLVHDAGDQFPITENADVLADICVDRGNELAAVELLAASTAIRSRIHADAKPLHLAHVEGLQQRLRQAVSPADYERHWQLGADSDLNTLVRRITIVAREIVGPRHPRPAFIPGTESEREHPLTNRELEVLGLLVQGKSTREISDLLFISPRTTTTHINNILGKIDVTSRAAAVAWAMRTGLT
ncbi:MAG: tetratricopeptide repeat protein, partial [Chloroflexota bacterium]|nr:tetratricopeptide repeat protein [Chloroflexota bacterium]